MNNTKKMVYTAVLIAVGILLPMAFHTVADAGRVFLPMHIPVLLCGMICGAMYGMQAGLLTPLLSSLLTGMPPAAILPTMMLELAVYGLCSGLFSRLIKTKWQILDVCIALVLAMLMGRFVGGFMNGVVLGNPNYTMKVWLVASFVTGLPGMIIQIIVIPTLWLALQKANLVKVDKYNLSAISRLRPSSNKASVTFFNNMAEKWDGMSNITDERLVNLMDMVDINVGDRVLDVACGTGIIDEQLVLRGAEEIVAIDNAEEMIKIAISKNAQLPVEYINTDLYDLKTDSFNKIIVFNAYPHFLNRRRFASKISSLLNENGELYIIHSESADVINNRHNKAAGKISNMLEPAYIEAKHFADFFNMNNMIDSDEMYMLAMTKKSQEEIAKPNIFCKIYDKIKTKKAEKESVVNEEKTSIQ